MSGGSAGGPTVSVSGVDGVGDVLVDAEGAALYGADQEASGMVLCTEACTTILSSRSSHEPRDSQVISPEHRSSPTSTICSSR